MELASSQSLVKSSIDDGSFLGKVCKQRRKLDDAPTVAQPSASKCDARTLADYLRQFGKSNESDSGDAPETTGDLERIYFMFMDLTTRGRITALDKTDHQEQEPKPAEAMLMEPEPRQEPEPMLAEAMLMEPQPYQELVPAAAGLVEPQPHQELTPTEAMLMEPQPHQEPEPAPAEAILMKQQPCQEPEPVLVEAMLMKPQPHQEPEPAAAEAMLMEPQPHQEPVPVLAEAMLMEPQPCQEPELGETRLTKPQLCQDPELAEAGLMETQPHQEPVPAEAILMKLQPCQEPDPMLVKAMLMEPQPHQEPELAEAGLMEPQPHQELEPLVTEALLMEPQPHQDLEPALTEAMLMEPQPHQEPVPAEAILMEPQPCLEPELAPAEARLMEPLPRQEPELAEAGLMELQPCQEPEPVLAEASLMEPPPRFELEVVSAEVMLMEPQPYQEPVPAKAMLMEPQPHQEPELELAEAGLMEPQPRQELEPTPAEAMLMKPQPCQEPEPALAATILTEPQPDKQQQTAEVKPAVQITTSSRNAVKRTSQSKRNLGCAGWRIFKSAIFLILCTVGKVVAPEIPKVEGHGERLKGEPYQLTCEASNTHDYTWFKDGVRLSEHTERTLNISSLSEGDSGQYQCVYRCGNRACKSDSFNLVVQGHPTLEPKVMEVEDGHPVPMRCSLDISTPALLTLYADSEKTTVKYTNSCSFEVGIPPGRDYSIVQCQASLSGSRGTLNDYARLYRKGMTVKVDRTILQPKGVPVLDRAFQLECRLPSLPFDGVGVNISFTLFHNGTPVRSQPLNGTFEFARLIEGDDGLYTCTATVGPPETVSTNSNVYPLRALEVETTTSPPTSTNKEEELVETTTTPPISTNKEEKVVVNVDELPFSTNKGVPTATADYSAAIGWGATCGGLIIIVVLLGLALCWSLDKKEKSHGHSDDGMEFTPILTGRTSGLP